MLKEESVLRPVPLQEAEEIKIPQGNFTPEAFESIVDTTKEYVCAGDIIQAVLSQRFQRPFAKSPLDLYRALRVINPLSVYVPYGDR